MADNDQKVKTLERATQQLDIIEQMITMLVDSLDLNSLKTSEKLNLALKLMTQHASTLKLYDDISRDHVLSSGQQALVSQMMRFMRNDLSEQELDELLSSGDESGAFSFKDGV